jgi:hypothetical protein
MNPDTPLVNKLTLLVLSLILVCLVLLVVRAYQKPRSTGEPSPVAEVELPPVATEEAPILEAPSVPGPPRVVRRATNVVRAPSTGQPAVPVNDVAPEAVAATTPLYSENQTLVSVSEWSERGVNWSTQGASLTGVAFLTGTPKPELPIDLGPTCSSLRTDKVTTRHFVVSPRGGGLANVLVYVQNVAAGRPLVEPPVLDQIGCMFEPYVLGVVAGQKIKIRNSDAVLHNIHATPKINREVNFAQPTRGQVNTLSFSRPELFVRIKCDVHPWMFAYVNVLPHPFFAITDTNGVFKIPAGLPAGDYTVSAVHLKAGELTQNVTLGDGQPRPLSFLFSVPAELQAQGDVARSN